MVWLPTSPSLPQNYVCQCQLSCYFLPGACSPLLCPPSILDKVECPLHDTVLSLVFMILSLAATLLLPGLPVSCPNPNFWQSPKGLWPCHFSFLSSPFLETSSIPGALHIYALNHPQCWSLAQTLPLSLDTCQCVSYTPWS